MPPTVNPDRTSNSLGIAKLSNTNNETIDYVKNYIKQCVCKKEENNLRLKKIKRYSN